MTRDRNEGDFGDEDSLAREFGDIFSGKPDGVPAKSTLEVHETQIGSKWAHIETQKYVRPSGEFWWIASWYADRPGLSGLCMIGGTRAEALQRVVEMLTGVGFGDT